MTRAAIRGIIDFSQFDPWDTWWWKKLRWILDEIAAEMDREVAAVQHNHWITLASHGRLNEESFDNVQTNAATALQRLFRLAYPWLADQLGDGGVKTDREQAIKDYQERFGKPGEPRYEQMIIASRKILNAPKRTQRQKIMDRRMTKLRRQQATRARKAALLQGD